MCPFQVEIFIFRPVSAVRPSSLHFIMMIFHNIGEKKILSYNRCIVLTHCFTYRNPKGSFQKCLRLENLTTHRPWCRTEGKMRKIQYLAFDVYEKSVEVRAILYKCRTAD